MMPATNTPAWTGSGRVVETNWYDTSLAIATAFLEGLQGQSSAGRFDFAEIADFLGENSKAFYKEWDKVTGATTPGI
jgi:hypothetical protein